MYNYKVALPYPPGRFWLKLHSHCTAILFCLKTHNYNNTNYTLSLYMICVSHCLESQNLWGRYFGTLNVNVCIHITVNIKCLMPAYFQRLVCHHCSLQYCEDRRHCRKHVMVSEVSISIVWSRFVCAGTFYHGLHSACLPALVSAQHSDKAPPGIHHPFVLFC